MRVLLPLLLFVVLSGCGSPDPVAEPVAEKKIDPQPVAPKAEAQPKNNPAPDTAGPQQAPVKPPANPQPAQLPVAEKPQQPVAPNRAPGKVPLLVSVRTKAGKKHVGDLIERTDAGLVVYDIVLRDTVSITKDQVQSFVEGIDERTASSHVPFATYAAWKLTKLLRIGTVQGRIALASDKGIFINLGSAHGLSAGQSVTLLGKAEEITDPETGEQLAVYRAPVATLKILAVVNERLSKLSITASDTPVKIERGMTVACERGSTTIVVIPPQWKSEDPNLKTGDEALYLTEHILAELVRFGVPVISRDQVEQAQAELSQKTGKPVATLPAATVGQTLKAGVLVTGQILAKGQTGNVTLHVTDLATRKYVGILTGRIRRDKIREESRKAKKAADDIKKQVGSLPAEMARRKKIATQLIEAGVYVALKLPNGTLVTYHSKQLPAPEVGFPPVFAFEQLHFTTADSTLALHLLSGTHVTYIDFYLPDSKAEYFTLLTQIPVQGVGFYLPIDDKHLPRLPKTLVELKFGARSRVTAEAVLRHRFHSTFHRFGGGGGIPMAKMSALHRRLKFHILNISASHLNEDWTSFVPNSEIMFEGFNAEMLRNSVEALRHSAYFRHRMKRFYFWGSSTERQLNDAMIELLLLSPEQRPTALRELHFNGVHLSTEVIARIRRAYPTVKVTHIPR